MKMHAPLKTSITTSSPQINPNTRNIITFFFIVASMVIQIPQCILIKGSKFNDQKLFLNCGFLLGAIIFTILIKCSDNKKYVFISSLGIYLLSCFVMGNIKQCRDNYISSSMLIFVIGIAYSMVEIYLLIWNAQFQPISSKKYIIIFVSLSAYIINEKLIIKLCSKNFFAEELYIIFVIIFGIFTLIQVVCIGYEYYSSNVWSTTEESEEYIRVIPNKRIGVKNESSKPCEFLFSWILVKVLGISVFSYCIEFTLRNMIVEQALENDSALSYYSNSYFEYSCLIGALFAAFLKLITPNDSKVPDIITVVLLFLVGIALQFNFYFIVSQKLLLVALSATVSLLFVNIIKYRGKSYLLFLPILICISYVYSVAIPIMFMVFEMFLSFTLTYSSICNIIIIFSMITIVALILDKEEIKQEEDDKLSVHVELNTEPKFEDDDDSEDNIYNLGDAKH